MNIKKQFKTIKDNWLIAALLFVLILIPLFSGTSLNAVTKSFTEQSYGMAESAVARDSYLGGVYYDNGFAPEIEERKITKNAYLTSEVERGEFKEAETQLKSLIEASDSFLLNENVNRYGAGLESYYQGSYQIKVETSKYNLAIDYASNAIDNVLDISKDGFVSNEVEQNYDWVFYVVGLLVAVIIVIFVVKKFKTKEKKDEKSYSLGADFNE